MKVYNAPESYIQDGTLTVFLAGSIEGDIAENWQNEVIHKLSGENLIILNPRRPKWDNTWKQEIENPQFNEQVTWELDGLENADVIVMYFDKSTKSPISLLELGLFSNSKKLVVCCPDGFWRKGNVDIVCHRYKIEQVDSLEKLIETIKTKLK